MTPERALEIAEVKIAALKAQLSTEKDTVRVLVDDGIAYMEENIALRAKVEELEARIATAHTAAGMVWGMALEVLPSDFWSPCPPDLLLDIGKQLMLTTWPKKITGFRPILNIQAETRNDALDECRVYVEKFATIVEDEPVGYFISAYHDGYDGELLQVPSDTVGAEPLYRTPQLPETGK